MGMRVVPFGLASYKIALLVCLHIIVLAKSESCDCPYIIEATLENMDKLITQQFRIDNITTTKTQKKNIVCVRYGDCCSLQPTCHGDFAEITTHAHLSQSVEIRLEIRCHVLGNQYLLQQIHYTEWRCIIKKDCMLSTHLCISSLAIMKMILIHFPPSWIATPRYMNIVLQIFLVW